MAIIETIDSLREKSQNKEMDKICSTIEKMLKETGNNGTTLGENIKAWGDTVFKMGEDEELIKIAEEKNKDKKVKNLFVERIKRRG